MPRLGGMDKEPRRTRAGQRRRDLAADVARLAHTADDDPSRTGENQVECAPKRIIQPVDQCEHGFTFDAQHARGELERRVRKRGVCLSHEIWPKMTGKV